MPGLRTGDERTHHGIIAERVTDTVDNALKNDKTLAARVRGLNVRELSASMAGLTAKTVYRLPSRKQKRLNLHSDELLRRVLIVLEEMIEETDPEASSRKSAETAGSLKGRGLGRIVNQIEGAYKLLESAQPQTLEHWAGAVAGAVEIQRNLRIARSTLDFWRKSGKVIALQKGVRKLVYPLDQFIDGHPAAGLDKINAIIGDQRIAWSWLSRYNPALDGKKPIELLKRGRVEGVLEAAHAYFNTP